MTILTSSRPISVKLDKDTTDVGIISIKLFTDLLGHSKLADIPSQELSVLLNNELTVMIDRLMPEIESLTVKYYKGYSE